MTVGIRQLGVAMLAIGSVVALIGASPAAESDAKRCAVNLDTSSIVCVAETQDLTAAVYAATGATLVYDAAEQMRGATVQAAYAIGEIYTYPSYGGVSYLVTAGHTCNAGYAYSYTNLGAIGWNDDIDSFKSFNGCQTKIWENTGFTGASYGYVTNSTDVGSMQNKASSIRWG